MRCLPYLRCACVFGGMVFASFAVTEHILPTNALRVNSASQRRITTVLPEHAPALLPLPLLFCGAANHPGHYRHEHRPFDPPSEVATSPDWPSSRQVPRGVAARDCGYLPIQVFAIVIFEIFYQLRKNTATAPLQSLRMVAESKLPGPQISRILLRRIT